MAKHGGDSADNAIWAVITLLIAVLLLSVLYFGGVFGGGASDASVGTQSTPNAQ